MHRDAFAARDVSNDALAANRIATLRAIYQQIVAALHLDYEIAGGSIRLSGRRWMRLRNLDSRRRFHLIGRKLLKHLPRGKFAIAQSRMQVFDFAAAIIPGDALQVGPADARKLRAETPSLALQILLADLDGLRPLRGIDDVPDFIARLGSLDQCQPILARQMTGLRQDLHHVAVFQRVLQRNDSPVHLRANASISHVAMDGISE